MNKHCASLELAKELKAANFNKVTQFLWVKYNDVTDNNKEKWDVTLHFWPTQECPHEHYYAPLATEILEELPDTIEFNKRNCSLRITDLSINSVRNYCVCYENYNDEDFNTDIMRDVSLSNALARMWLYLKCQALV